MNTVNHTPARPGRTVILGQGYVGLPVAIRAAEVGHQVIGFDIDEQRIKRLQAAESFTPDTTGAQIADALDSGRYLPSANPDDLDGFTTAVITVPTPLRDGAPDLTAVEHAARLLAPHLRPGALVVLESTSYPGTTEDVVAPLLECGSHLRVGEQIRLGYSPERIDPGNPTWSLRNTPKIVSGVDAASRTAIAAFYRTIVDTVVEVPCVRDAELAKVLENTFRQVNIALVNEVTMHARAIGADIWNALDAAATKPFGFQRFNPGPGVGGHCLPIDPAYLSWQIRQATGAELQIVNAAERINQAMPRYIVQRITAALARHGTCPSEAHVLLLGLAYKPNSSDTRNSPALAVAEILTGIGAKVTAYDPHLSPQDTPAIDALQGQVTSQQLESCDAVVLLTDHDVFDFQLIERHSSYVLDCRGRLRGPSVERL